jgi:hypothetical protein
MHQRFLNKFTALGLSLGAVTLAASQPASACGGFFCSQAQPVNQAAERIIFSDNGDGTLTAIIQIQYEGPSENFSWVLPVSTALEPGQLAVASDLAFTRLQAATNPQFNLTTTVEGTCRGSGALNAAADGAARPVAETCSDNPLLAQCGSAGGVVDVESSGVVGAFEYTVISVEAGVADPAAPARDWLTANGYDVTPEGAALLGPYLADGMHLLALRLTKGSDVGSIRPIQITYPASAPMIPIKLTAVAANQDMGVMTWTLGGSRGVPFNYNALELNEARINWFNAASNYGQVVNEAADAAGGQGFVTEFAGPSAQLADVVWPSSEEADWQGVKGAVYASFNDLFQAVYQRYQGYNGFWDAVRRNVTLPEQVAFEDFKLCPGCYGDDIEFKPTEFLAAIDTEVLEPIRGVQKLIDRAPYATRLYSTLSAAEMTVDPLFVFNADLPDVNNVHSATRVTECNPSVYEYQANWHIEFPQGGVIRGTPEDVGQWPDVVAEQPANYQVLQLARSGEGEVVADNAEAIDGLLANYNESVPSTAGMTGTSEGGMCALGSRGARPGTRLPLAAALVTLLGAAWLRRRKAGAQAGSALGS